MQLNYDALAYEMAAIIITVYYNSLLAHFTIKYKCNYVNII